MLCVTHKYVLMCISMHFIYILHACSANQKPAIYRAACWDTSVAGVLGHSLANQKPEMHSGAFCSVHLVAPSTFSQAQAARLLGSVRPNRARALIPRAQPN